MKKLLSIFMLMLIALSSFSASAAFTMKVNVDDPERVTFGYIFMLFGFLEQKAPCALTEVGENEVYISEANPTGFYVEGKNGATITSVTLDGTAVPEANWANFTGCAEGSV
ncbi:MAG: hypothetical protein HUK13_04055, partial [Muribaculaceae bacterium]|nr:hypothetical protein [Muribaculaceae bacterium]